MLKVPPLISTWPVRMRRAAKLNGRVADEQHVAEPGRGDVIGQGEKFRLQPAFRQQHPQEIHAGAGGRVEVDGPDLFQRFTMRQKDAGHRPVGADGGTVQHVVAVMQQHFGDTDQCGVQMACVQLRRQLRRGQEMALPFDPAGERHGVEIRYGADAKRGRRHPVSLMHRPGAGKSLEPD